MRVLVDTNVVLDLFLDRVPFADAAEDVFCLVERSEIEGFLCATTITTVDYLLCQELPRERAQSILQKLMGLFEIAPVNRSVLERALAGRMTDFEDAVLSEAAALVSAEVIITRNQRDFRLSSIPALAPDEFLVQYRG